MEFGLSFIYLYRLTTGDEWDNKRQVQLLGLNIGKILSDFKKGIRTEFYLYRLPARDDWDNKRQVQLLG